VHPDLDRLLAFVCRELGAREAVVVEQGAERSRADDPREIECLRPDGRTVVARFDIAPTDREAKLRRLEMLVGTFSSAIGESSPGESAPGPFTRPAAAEALHTELEELGTRAAALNAVVIDANSPVVWGAAEPEGLATDWSTGAGTENSVAAGPRHDTALIGLSRAAVDALRGDRDISSNRKGRHVRHIERAGDVPFVAHSFAGIYWLILVFDAPFDELRAERAMLESLPRVERLVMALPPMDPSPQAGARAMARKRR
jgi:hypothetical protein